MSLDGDTREADAMTDLQIYLSLAPLVLLALGVLGYLYVRFFV